MIKSKKGADIAINIIIFAVIALLVLVVVLFIFGGKINVFSRGVSECEALNGDCYEERCSDLEPPKPAITNGECEAPEGEKRYCCSRVLG